MRVALVTDGIWPYVLGGMQKHAYYLCKYLAQTGVQVDLYHFNQSAYNIDELAFFSEKEKKLISSTVVDFPTVAVPFPGHYLYRSRLHARRVFHALRPHLHTYDFIYTKGFTGWHLIRLKAKGRIQCAPVGVKFHGYEMFQKPPDFKSWLQYVVLLRRPVRYLSLHADVVFSYGGKITSIIRALGVQEQRIVELPSGVEAATVVNDAGTRAGVFRFLFLGRYERRKGIEELNAALAMLFANKAFTDAEVHFIGPIPEERHMADERCIYHGEIRSREGLQELIRTCDVLLCPSWSEGLPNVILEAMANGLSVIATDVGATRVVVNTNNGWLLPEPQPVKIAEAMLAALALPAPQLLEKKRAALHTIKQTFTWERLIGQLLARIAVLSKNKMQ